MINEDNLGIGDFYDEPIEVQTEENDDIIPYESFDGTDAILDNEDLPSDEIEEKKNPGFTFGDETEEELALLEEQQKKTNEDTNDKKPANVKFDQEDHDKDIFKEEDAVEKLKALGYDVKKDAAASPEDYKRVEIQKLDTVISNLEKFTQKEDMDLCIQRATEDLKAKYTKEGMLQDIGGAEFNLELEAELEEYKYNPRMVSLEAKTIRNDINNFINEKKGEKSQLEADINKVEEEQIRKNRTELKNSLTPFVNSTFLGVKISEDVVKNSYAKITSGEFAKTINNDKSIQAEFAMYLEIKDQLKSSGNRTFGEGVAAAVHQIEGQGKPKTSTSLDKVVTRPNAGNSIANRIAQWASRSEVKE